MSQWEKPREWIERERERDRFRNRDRDRDLDRGYSSSSRSGMHHNRKKKQYFAVESANFRQSTTFNSNSAFVRMFSLTVLKKFLITKNSYQTCKIIIICVFYLSQQAEYKFSVVLVIFYKLLLTVFARVGLNNFLSEMFA